MLHSFKTSCCRGSRLYTLGSVTVSVMLAYTCVVCCCVTVLPSAWLQLLQRELNTAKLSIEDLLMPFVNVLPVGVKKKSEENARALLASLI